jgi:hypothetical protein
MRIKIIHITPLGLFNIRLNILTPRAITSAATAATATTALAAALTAVSAATGADTAGKTLKALACANCRGRCARDLQVRTRLGAPEWLPAGMIVGVVIRCIKPTARPPRTATVA